MEYKIKIETFEGPMDLLLHLIKDNKLDIYDIPIIKITAQYMEYIELMKDLNLDIAGDFLVMAAELTRIKSKLLLPAPIDEEGEEEEGGDPRDELVRKLIEYKIYKEAADELRDKESYQMGLYKREENKNPEKNEEDEPIILDVSLFDLVSAFRNLMKEISHKTNYEISVEEVPVGDKIEYIRKIIEVTPTITFDTLFKDIKSKIELIATFLALLELIRLKEIRAYQNSHLTTIRIIKIPDEEKAECL